MLLKAYNVSKDYKTGIWSNKKIKAVDNFSIEVKKGESIGLIGQSGCGKSTVARIITRLINPTKGEILFDGKNILSLNKRETFNLRKDLQIIFQNPQQTFNPRFKIYNVIAEPLRLYSLVENKDEEKKKILEIIDTVGITRDQLDRYPHEISGGQAQRIAISRVLALNPKLIVADEPTSMLDVSVQAQILSLFKEIRKERNMGMIFISHDLDVVKEMCENVIVMKEGKIVEECSSSNMYSYPVYI